VGDRALARAVAQAYGSVLEPGRYPVGVVHIDLPRDQVDVNVHPQKAEVRFADGRGLFDAVTRELHTALARAFSIPALGARRAWSPFPPAPDPRGATPEPSAWLGASNAATDASGLAERIELADPWQLTEIPAASQPFDASPEVTVPCPPPVQDAADPTPLLFEGAGFYGSLVFLSQVRSMFLLCEGRDGLYVLDQHAAAERVTFHKLRAAFAARSIATQRLLLAETVTLTPSEIAVLEERADQVASFGVELRSVGPSAVAVHAVPNILARMNPERIVRDLVAELSHAARRPYGDASDRVLATMACHGSVRAGDSVAREEAVALLRALDAVDFAGHCPHGRPVVTRIGFDELERRVGR
jgi:DNA mismatch repair protein MutL